VEAAPPIFNWVMKGEGKEDVVAQDELSEWWVNEWVSKWLSTYM
jgi:hypothetical protein